MNPSRSENPTDDDDPHAYMQAGTPCDERCSWCGAVPHKYAWLTNVGQLVDAVGRAQTRLYSVRRLHRSLVKLADELKRPTGVVGQEGKIRD